MTRWTHNLVICPRIMKPHWELGHRNSDRQQFCALFISSLAANSPKKEPQTTSTSSWRCDETTKKDANNHLFDGRQIHRPIVMAVNVDCLCSDCVGEYHAAEVLTVNGQIGCFVRFVFKPCFQVDLLSFLLLERFGSDLYRSFTIVRNQSFKFKSRVLRLSCVLTYRIVA